MKALDVYLEVGAKRTFAGAIDWPGWCRSGRDEVAAIEALAGYGRRYERALRGSRLGFKAPAGSSALRVIERLKGSATTDFGAPDAEPKADAKPVGDAELRRFGSLLRACWRTFDAAVEAAEGTELRAGPRGGGRDLRKLREHVLDAEEGYLSKLGWRPDKGDASERADRTRRAILEGLAASARGKIPSHGPRGGVRWTVRAFVRRAAWHVLDHAWEIEDRSSA